MWRNEKFPPLLFMEECETTNLGCAFWEIDLYLS